MENLSEYIGLFIVLFLFLFPALKKWLADKDKKRRGEQGRDEQEIEPEFEEEEEIEYYEPPPPKPKPKPLFIKPKTTERLVKRDFEFHGKIEEREFETDIEERHIGTRVDPHIERRLVSGEFLVAPVAQGGRQRSPTLEKVLQGRNSKQALVLLSEIMSQPKGME